MQQNLDTLLSTLDSLSTTSRMPALFIGHGNPLNAINESAVARTWESIGIHLPIPRAIVCISAHWLTDSIFISSSAKPELIYDFYGFPEELYTVTYPAVGNIDIAREIQALLPKSNIDTERGLDHGAWTVLKHLFPNADVPVLQISIDFQHSRKEQFEQLQLLKPLRDAGILFIGSGNIVHNLGLMSQNSVPEWVTEFDALSKKLIVEKNIDVLLDIETHSDKTSLAIPFDDHYRPMLNTLALLDENESVLFFNEEIELGTISMRSFISH